MLTYQDSYIKIKETDPETAILGIAAIEKHGVHLPIGTDYFIVEEITRQVAEVLEDEVYLLPTFPFGTSIEHSGKPGTVYIRYRTLMNVIKDLVESLYFQGIKRVVIINNHGRADAATIVPQGNYITKTAVRQLNYDHPESSVIWVQPFSEAGHSLSKIFESYEQDIHAGEIETSILLYLQERLVKDEKKSFVPKLPEEFTSYLQFDRLSADSVWGKPELASREKGEKAFKIIIQKTRDYIVDTFNHLDNIKN